MYARGTQKMFYPKITHTHVHLKNKIIIIKVLITIRFELMARLNI